MKHLIISADDYGMSKIFDKVIMELLHKRRVTSISVLVYRKNITSSARKLIQLKTEYNFSIGLHLEVNKMDNQLDINDQFIKFRNIFNITPSHIDIHKGQLYLKHFQDIYTFCASHSIPFRNHGDKIPSNVKSTNLPFFLATGKSIDQIINWILKLQNNSINEIVFHPGYFDSHSKSNLNKARELDLLNINLLCSQIYKLKINLVSYDELTN